MKARLLFLVLAGLPAGCATGSTGPGEWPHHAAAQGMKGRTMTTRLWTTVILAFFVLFTVAGTAVAQKGGQGPAPKPNSINLNSSRSNVYRTTPVVPAPTKDQENQDSTSLNSSRSNVYRTTPVVPAPTKDQENQEAINKVKDTKSNTSLRSADPALTKGQEDATTVKGSSEGATAISDGDAVPGDKGAPTKKPIKE